VTIKKYGNTFGERFPGIRFIGGVYGVGRCLMWWVSECFMVVARQSFPTDEVIALVLEETASVYVFLKYAKLWEQE
jgi:hypothetical protein